jgi:hypothetical protein
MVPGSALFLQVIHSFFIEECKGVPADQDEAVMKLVSKALASPTFRVAELSAAIFKILGRTVTFPNRIHEILTVPDDPSPGLYFERRSQDPARWHRLWSKEEDNRLFRAIQRFGVNDWGQISTFVGPGRTRAQCSQRWNRGLNPQLNKCSWSAHEEEMLCELVARYGVKSWTKIAHEIPTRSDVQCRYHFFQIQRGRSARRLESPTDPLPQKEEPVDLQSEENSSTWDLFAPTASDSLFSFTRSDLRDDPFF